MQAQISKWSQVLHAKFHLSRCMSVISTTAGNDEFYEFMEYMHTCHVHYAEACP